MAAIQSYAPVLALAIPFAASLLILAFRNHEFIRESWTVIASVVNFAVVLSLLPLILAGNTAEYAIMQLLPGLEVALRVDAFGLIFALTSSSLWVANSFYSIGYMRALKEHGLTRYFFCFAVAIASAMGIAFSANLWTMFIFYEILTLSTYPLVVHNENEAARQAGRKYIAYLLTAGIFFLFSLIVTYALTGTTAFEPGGILAGHGTALMQQILFVTFLVGFAKAAWMPLHSWLPSAMVAPTPVSALLHAVAVVKAGAFGIIRIVCFIFGIDLMANLGLGVLLAVIASITIIVASMFALAQDNLKRRLAYSTIGQLSYILLGVALLTPLGITGAMIHIPFHAFMKITLFFCAGAIIVAAGIENISDMKGLARSMPVTMTAFAIGAIAVIGLPPACGLISKWYLVLGTVQAHEIALLLVLIGSTVLNVAYFFPILYTAFFEEPEGGAKGIREAPMMMLAPLVATALISIALGLYPDLPFLRLAEMAVQNLMGVV
ncbi:monovalent cation/H+ antiporter subunit D family protein [Methanoculleus sp. FWC-SCC1]|uniref:Monovalent cation/H+ antiporter subunit D family protein n=1 Tax=Methanoculleus frigidifontis TaxID=2584085 RepID=A0ABT8M845_9EURY|nr:monovalent cation/H+ antiporter subunit D family protein [Methanoculleus sp. FWC-SCC1]MDN7024097.1 monovalent cation/H+ antiporter subunit D family protein [Methanoculleus sp. FWC-SCC1]